MEIEWLILAEAAQVVGQKLYLLGGGWDRLTISNTPMYYHMAVAASFKVPWNETNVKKNFEIGIVDGNGTSLGKVNGQFEVGRAPGIEQGKDQRTQIAVNINWNITKPGLYQIDCSVGEARRSFPFTVVTA